MIKQILFAFFLSLSLAGMIPSPQNYTRIQGWYKGKKVYYYNFENGNFGTSSTVNTAPIYLFRHSNNVSDTALQINLVDVIPGDTGYSDLWLVNIVVVTDDTIIPVRSKTDLDTAVGAGKASIHATAITVNCPVVGNGSKVEMQDENQVKYVFGFYKGQTIFYFDFGANPATTLPIWPLVRKNETSPVPRNNIINTATGDAGYSAFWWVYLVPVRSDYVANTYTTRDQIMNAPTTELMKLVNCPIVALESTVTGDTTSVYMNPNSATKIVAGIFSIAMMIILVTL